MLHIYDWLSDKYEVLDSLPIEERMVWEYLDFRTLAAAEQYDPEKRKKILGLKVFCEYEGEKYRMTGASRMGDVWLKHITPEVMAEIDPSGYNLRVDMAMCTNFSFIDEREPLPEEAKEKAKGVENAEE